jgi:alkylation response protein AidB-like acyl-CoA dehydrogenase
MQEQKAVGRSSARVVILPSTGCARADEPRAGSVLMPRSIPRQLPAETARWSTITQIYEGTNQIQRVVMARQLLK